MYNLRNRFYFVLLLLFSFIALVLSHSHHLHNSNKEREEDGAKSPRDSDHFTPEGHNIHFDHEAILGSHSEAQELDDMPVEEAKKRLEILLGKMDRNADRHIERRELTSWILRSFEMLSKEESEEKLRDMDSNRDGEVSWAEYLEETYGIEGEDDINIVEGDERTEEKELIKDDKEIWNAADLNKDGTLNRVELLAFTHPEESPIMGPVLYKQTMATKDTDKDGLLSFQEFYASQGAGASKEDVLVEKEKFDYEYDTNKDGVLDESEVIHWIIPSNEEIAEQETDHLFASADDDVDDILTFDEILLHHEVFVGSEATDYGEHLENIERFADEL